MKKSETICIKHMYNNFEKIYTYENLHLFHSLTERMLQNFGELNHIGEEADK